MRFVICLFAFYCLLHKKYMRGLRLHPLVEPPKRLCRLSNEKQRKTNEFQNLESTSRQILSNCERDTVLHVLRNFSLIRPMTETSNFLYWTNRCLGHPANWSRHSLSAATSALDSTSRKVALRSEMSAGFSAFIASGPRQQVNFDSFRTYHSSSCIS